MARAVLSNGPGSVMEKLYEAGLIPEMTRRVVIDLEVQSVAKIYIETYGTDALHHVGLTETLMDVTPIAVSDGELVTVEDGEGEPD